MVCIKSVELVCEHDDADRKIEFLYQLDHILGDQSYSNGFSNDQVRQNDREDEIVFVMLS